MRIFQYSYLLCLSLVFVSCAIVKPVPQEIEAMPNAFSQELSQDVFLGSDAFISSQLRDILAQSVYDNLDIKQAESRLLRAENLAVIARSKRIFTFDLNARADLAYSDGEQTRDDYLGGFVSSYELDLWGKVRASHMAAKMNTEKFSQDLKTVYISTTSSVAKTYFQLQARIKITDLLKEQLKINQEYQTIMEERFFSGLATALDVLQQKQAVAKIESAIPLSLREEELLRHMLSILVGVHSSYSLHIMPEKKLPVSIDLPEAGVPLALLHKRPDVRSAYYNLQKYFWELSGAKLSRLPSITVNVSGGFGFDDLNKFLATIAGNAVLPFFRGGAKNAEIAIARANVEEYIAVYRKAILVAVKDTEDAMVKIKTQKDYLDGLNQELMFAKRTYREARNRYFNGSAEYSLVVSKLLLKQNLEQSFVAAQKDLCLFYIDFYRSCGEFLTDELESFWESLIKE